MPLPNQTPGPENPSEPETAPPKSRSWLEDIFVLFSGLGALAASSIGIVILLLLFGALFWFVFSLIFQP